MIAKRPKGIPTTKVTNELADAVNLIDQDKRDRTFAGRTAVVVRIDETTSYAGVYVGTIYKDDVPAEHEAALDADAIGGVSEQVATVLNVSEVDGSDTLAVGRSYVGFFAGWTFGNVERPIIMVQTGGGSNIQFVQAEQDGGIAGSESAWCTYTYTLRPYGGGEALATGAILQTQRFLMAEYEPGTTGIIMWSDGTPLLMWVDESANTDACE